MTTAIDCRPAPIAVDSFMPGQSPGAQEVRTQAAKAAWSILKSISIGWRRGQTLNALGAVFQDASSENWDGDSAMRVAPATLRTAEEVVSVFPLGIEDPSVGVEPDGHVTLEWYRSPHRLISISVSPEGDLHYAALIGASQAHGTEPFLGQMPPPIMSLIRRVCAE